MKLQPGRDIFVCGPSLIVSLTKLGLIDKYWLCVRPLIAGGGLQLISKKPISCYFLGQQHEVGLVD
ncbi:hypothetical protein EHQ30_04300 [Leptospira brenneri]|uniref:Bacterial bifunctional deaminase-reductase C-terminal domain-containing protein n=1 Tax=Leptospira brenneri TaxID=2023182 RepID=A0A5F1Z8E5_9LEPT|nr:hypothetical protein EHQ30_04300 [Leptospira brenneri]